MSHKLCKHVLSAILRTLKFTSFFITRSSMRILSGKRITRGLVCFFVKKSIWYYFLSMKSAWCMPPPCEYQSSAVLVIAPRMSEKTWKTFWSASCLYWLDIGLFVIYSQSIYAKPKTKPRTVFRANNDHSLHVFVKANTPSMKDSRESTK